jgi:hypothetical protein
VRNATLGNEFGQLVTNTVPMNGHGRPIRIWPTASVMAPQDAFFTLPQAHVPLSPSDTSMLQSNGVGTVTTVDQLYGLGNAATRNVADALKWIQDHQQAWNNFKASIKSYNAAHPQANIFGK